jgi:hypothetical protein
MQLLRDTNQSNAENPNSVRRQANRYFRKKRAVSKRLN